MLPITTGTVSGRPRIGENRALTAILAVLTVILVSATPAAAQLDQLLKGIPGISQTAPDNTKLVAGLKEALQVATQNAVTLTGKLDGYYRNPAIKIPMPEQLRTLDAGLRGLGYGSRVDEFVLGMNPANQIDRLYQLRTHIDFLRRALGDYGGRDPAGERSARREISG